MLVEWKDSYSIGIDELDSHHKKLLELLNKSYFLLLQESTQAEVSQVLDELIEYTKYHFLAEEKLMGEFHYQQMDQHILEHIDFTNKVFSFKIQIIEGKKHLSVEVFDFIKNWLLDHIFTTDAEMSKAIRFKQCSDKVNQSNNKLEVGLHDF